MTEIGLKRSRSTHISISLWSLSHFCLHFGYEVSLLNLHDRQFGQKAALRYSVVRSGERNTQNLSLHPVLCNKIVSLISC